MSSASRGGPAETRSHQELFEEASYLTKESRVLQTRLEIVSRMIYEEKEKLTEVKALCEQEEEKMVKEKFLNRSIEKLLTNKIEMNNFLEAKLHKAGRHSVAAAIAAVEQKQAEMEKACAQQSDNVRINTLLAEIASLDAEIESVKSRAAKLGEVDNLIEKLATRQKGLLQTIDDYLHEEQYLLQLRPAAIPRVKRTLFP